MTLTLIAKTPAAHATGVFYSKPGDDLLSHGESPHYHRRYFVSLLSSGWDQVVPKLFGRQAKLVMKIRLLSSSIESVVVALHFCA